MRASNQTALRYFNCLLSLRSSMIWYSRTILAFPWQRRFVSLTNEAAAVGWYDYFASQWEEMEYFFLIFSKNEIKLFFLFFSSTSLFVIELRFRFSSHSFLLKELNNFLNDFSFQESAVKWTNYKDFFFFPVHYPIKFANEEKKFCCRDI